MSAGFTPGPWWVSIEYSTLPDGWVIKAGGHTVAHATYLGGTDPALRNAHLIAASPELYEALKRAVILHGDGGYSWVESAKAALRKARGDLVNPSEVKSS